MEKQEFRNLEKMHLNIIGKLFFCIGLELYSKNISASHILPGDTITTT